MNLFLGNKKELGAEIKITDKDKNGSLLGYGRLWFGGQFLGTMHELIYIDGYLMGGLIQMLKVPLIDVKNLPSNKSKEFAYFKTRIKNIDDNQIDCYKVSFGTLTDSFTIIVYRDNDNITILWKINKSSQRLMYNDLKKYPDKVFKYTIKYEKFKEFVERISRLIKDW